MRDVAGESSDSGIHPKLPQAPEPDSGFVVAAVLGAVLKAGTLEVSRRSKRREDLLVAEDPRPAARRPGRGGRVALDAPFPRALVGRVGAVLGDAVLVLVSGLEPVAVVVALLLALVPAVEPFPDVLGPIRIGLVARWTVERAG